eukprot:scaffold210447_cov13-Prasinocladus_malaysianus.AAC.1
MIHAPGVCSWRGARRQAIAHPIGHRGPVISELVGRRADPDIRRQGDTRVLVPARVQPDP